MSDNTPSNAYDDNRSGKRLYIHPVTKEIFPSVTTILGILDKGGLPYWYGKQSAIRALELIPLLRRAGTRRMCEDGSCGMCVSCLLAMIQRAGSEEAERAADRGRRFHVVARHYGVSGEIIEHDEDIEPQVAMFQEFARRHEVVVLDTEATIINRSHGYAGTLDAVVTCGWMPPKWEHLIGTPMIIDYKTKRSKGAYDWYAYQLAAYQRGETILEEDGAESPLTPSSPDWALSLTISADNWHLRPCDISDETFARFARILSVYADTTSPSPIGRSMYKGKRGK